MTNLLTIRINTERLAIVSTSVDTTAVIFHEFTNVVTKYMMTAVPFHSLEEEAESIYAWRERMKKGESLALDIFDKKTNEFFGRTFLIGIPTGKIEIGIWIKATAHGNKYGREAVTALKKWVDKHVIYSYLLYPVDKRNTASRKIAESLGGKIEREYEKMNQSQKMLYILEYKIYPQVIHQV